MWISLALLGLFLKNYWYVYGQSCSIGCELDMEYCCLETKGDEECPYKDVQPFWKFRFSGNEDVRIYMPAKYDEYSGYYRFKDVAENHDQFINAKGTGCNCNTPQPCMAMDTNQVILTRCDDEHITNICYYDNTWNFCAKYDQICGDDEHCHCETSITDGYFCKELCTSRHNSHCCDCDKKFEKYGTPSLHLFIDGSDLALEVKNPLKLMFLWYNSSEGYEFTCYSNVLFKSYNVKNIEPTPIWRFELIGEDMYKFVSDAMLPGYYWCKAFAYPNLEEITSNKVYFEPVQFDFIFVISKSLDGLLLGEDPFSKIGEVKKLLKFDAEVVVADLFNRSIATIQIMGDFTEEFNNIDLILPELQSISDFSVKHLKYCLETVSVHESFNLTWPQMDKGRTTLPNKLCITKNNTPLRRKCIEDLVHGAYWETITESCTIKTDSGVTGLLIELLNSNMSNIDLTNHLNIIYNDTYEIEPFDIFLTGKILSNIAARREELNVKSFINAISLIMDTDDAILEDSQKILNATDLILGNIDVILGNYAKDFVKTETRASSRNLNIHIYKYTPNVSLSVTFFKNDVSRFTVDSDEISEYNEVRFMLVIPKIVESYETDKDIFLVSSAFKKYSFFNNGSSKDKIITGWIPSIFLTKPQLPLNMEVIVRPYRNYRRQHYCSFWKFGLDNTSMNILGDWFDESEPTKQKQYLRCKFDHMTHFAILLDNPSNQAISIISTIGSAISLFAILLIFITAFICKKWRESDGGKIALNVCILTIIQISFLTLAEFVDSLEQETLCVIVGVCLHYSVISQFFWNFVVAILQYRKFVIVFTSSPKHLLRVCFITGWALPIIPISITLVFSYESYLRDEYCYLTGPELLFAVFIPVGIIILFNLIIFVRIFVEFCCRKVESYGGNQKMFRLYARLAFFLFFTMGFTWAFGLLNGFFKTQVLSYLFTIGASLQGLIMFWFHVLLNQDAKYTWMKLLRKIVKAPPKEDRSTDVPTTSKTSVK